MSTPSPSPSSPPPPSPPSNSNPPQPHPVTTLTAIAATKKPQPVPWTHPETIHLIQTYQEKWYSLKRGQLRAHEWDQIALTVAARCGYDFSHHPAKSPIQCRHKMEKLRKRFRVEKQRHGPSSLWHYYQLMDSLDRGPVPPIAARPLALYPFSANEAPDSDHSEPINEDDYEDDEEGETYSKSRSINYILRRPSLVNRFAGSGETFSGFVQNSLRKRRIEEEEEVEEGERGRGRNFGFELAAEIRGFAKSVMRVERRKMEMIRETAKYRMDMENKRIEMIRESQRKVVDTIEKAFGTLPENLKSEQEV